MKYLMTSVKDGKTFKPFSITITFETYEEANDFATHAMPRITGGGIHNMHGDFCKMREGYIERVEGDI